MNNIHNLLFRCAWLRITISLILLTLPLIYGLYKNWGLDDYYKAYSIWGLICTGFNFIIAYQQKIVLNRYSNIFKLIEKYDSEYLRVARDFSRKHSQKANSISPNDLLKNLNEDENLFRSVIYLFNFWEVLYRMIEYDTLDEDWAKRYFYNPFISNYEIYKAWIDDKDSYKSKDKYGKEAIKKLYERWHTDD